MGIVKINTCLRKRFEMDGAWVEGVKEEVIGTSVLALSNPVVLDLGKPEEAITWEGAELVIKANKFIQLVFGVVTPRHILCLTAAPLLFDKCDVSVPGMLFPRGPQKAFITISTKKQLVLTKDSPLLYIIAME